MKFLTVVVFFLYSINCLSQNLSLLYSTDELPQTLMSNPGAKINFSGHMGVPLFSAVKFSVGSTGVDLYDIFATSGPGINTRVKNTIRRLTREDYFSVQEQWDVIFWGRSLNRDYYLSAGIYQELDAFAYFPKDLAILANEGNRNYINKPFDFSDVAFTAEVLAVYHVGIHKKVNENLNLGIRAKFYSGIFNVESVNNSGFFVTRFTPGELNYYRHYAEGINLRVNTSGYASLRDNNSTVQEATADVLKRSMFGGNIGLGLDIGGTYRFNENLISSAAIQDVGIMFQKKDVENYLYSGSYATSGIEPIFPDLGPSESAIPYWDIFEDELDRNLVDETLNESYTTWRPFKLNAGLAYRFEEICFPCDYRSSRIKRYRNKVGLYFSGINRPRSINYSLTTYYNRKFSPYFSARLAYTIDDFSYTNVGLLMSTQINKFNIYIAANNLIGYFNLAKANTASVQFGFQFIFTRT